MKCIVDGQVVLSRTSESPLAARTVQINSFAKSVRERALVKMTPRQTKPGRCQPGDRLLGFLDSL